MKGRFGLASKMAFRTSSTTSVFPTASRRVINCDQQKKIREGVLGEEKSENNKVISYRQDIRVKPLEPVLANHLNARLPNSWIPVSEAALQQRLPGLDGERGKVEVLKRLLEDVLPDPGIRIPHPLNNKGQGLLTDFNVEHDRLSHVTVNVGKVEGERKGRKGRPSKTRKPYALVSC